MHKSITKSERYKTMRVQSISLNNQPQQRVALKTNSYQTPPMANDSVKFTGLMPNEAKKLIKLCVYDLDDTLLKRTKAIRNKIFDFSKDKILVYSSARGLSKVQPLIDKKTLIMPNYCICNNGLNIYKNVNGKFEEIKSYSEVIGKPFNKGKIRDFMTNLAKENMFTKEEWSKVPADMLPEGQKEFRGSKITEYETFGSPLNIYFMMAPGIFKKTFPNIEKQLTKEGIEADVNFQNFDKNNLDNGLQKFFPANIARDMKNHALPRVNPDGSIDVAIITAKGNKGTATEFIRKDLGLKENEIFASGDDVNDYTNTNKGYWFAFISNSTKALKKLIGKNPPENIIKTTKPGVKGIWEVLEP